MSETPTTHEERVTCRVCRGLPVGPGRICPDCNGRGWHLKRHPEWTPEEPARVEHMRAYHPEMQPADFDYCATCRHRRNAGHREDCPWES